MIHELKIHPEYFAEVVLGNKKSEVRLNDRNYRVGDVLLLCEWDKVSKSFTGRTERRRITHIQSLNRLMSEFGCECFRLEYVVLSVKAEGK